MRKLALAPDGLSAGCIERVLKDYRLALCCDDLEASLIKQRHAQRLRSFELVLISGDQEFLPYVLPSGDDLNGNFHLRLESSVANLGSPQLLVLVRPDKIAAAMMSLARLRQTPAELWLCKLDDFILKMLEMLKYTQHESGVDQIFAFRVKSLK